MGTAYELKSWRRRWRKTLSHTYKQVGLQFLHFQGQFFLFSCKTITVEQTTDVNILIAQWEVVENLAQQKMEYGKSFSFYFVQFSFKDKEKNT